MGAHIDAVGQGTALFWLPMVSLALRLT